MNKPYIAAFFLALLWLALAPVAFCSDITGEVVGPQGPVAGAQITVTDSVGNVVGQATTNDAGRYCITGLSPGNYTTAVNPPAGAGFKTGTANEAIPAQGLTENWSLSSATLASSSVNTPGVCGAAAWWVPSTPVEVFLGVGAVAGISMGICASLGCISDSSPPVTTFK